MGLKAEIEARVLQEYENPTMYLGDDIDDMVFLAEGVNLDQALIDDLNDHPVFMDYAGFIRWVWAKIKEAARWLWDKLFGDD